MVMSFRDRPDMTFLRCLQVRDKVTIWGLTSDIEGFKSATALNKAGFLIITSKVNVKTWKAMEVTAMVASVMDIV